MASKSILVASLLFCLSLGCQPPDCDHVDCGSCGRLSLHLIWLLWAFHQYSFCLTDYKPNPLLLSSNVGNACCTLEFRFREFSRPLFGEWSVYLLLTKYGHVIAYSNVNFHTHWGENLSPNCCIISVSSGSRRT